jgi:hypothetical protein
MIRHPPNLEYNRLCPISNTLNFAMIKTVDHPAKESSTLRFQDYNILIVDDTPLNLGVVVEYLQSSQWRNGPEASPLCST